MLLMFCQRCFFLLALLLSLRSTAQQTVRAVRIQNQETRLPLADITVHTPDFSFIRISDENGWVNLRGLPAGTNRLYFSGLGFATLELALDSITDQQVISLRTRISSLNEVVVNATARKGVFHTISDLDIHVRPINNSQEVLRIVPGLFIGQHAGGGKAEQIFLRGFDIDHGTDIQITVDGMPVNMVSHAHGQGYADLHFLIPELIQKVNFDKGPYFADKGNLATAGYVEFKSRDYLERNFIKTEAGQFNTYRLVGGVNLLSEQQRNAQQSLFLAAEASYTKGYFDSPQDFNRFNGLVKYHGKISPRSYLTLSASAFSSRWDASGQIPDRAVDDGSIGWYGAIDDNEGGKTSRYNFNALLSTELENGLRWKNQLYYSRYQFELYSNFTFFLNDPVNGDQVRQKEQRNLLGFNSTIEKEQEWGTMKTKFQGGAQVRMDATGNSELSRTKARNQVTNPIMIGDIRELNAGLFAEEKLYLNPSWDLSLGLRGDYFSNQYNDKLFPATLRSHSFIVSPKLNLRYLVNKNIQLYWYNGKGFHSNDTRVAVQQQGKDVVTPAWGSDLGAVWKLSPKLVLQTAFWYLWLKQEFVYVGDEGVVEAGGKTERLGWDAAIRYELMPRLFADADLNITKPRALGLPGPESYLPLAPRITSTGGITYRQAAGWSGSLRYRYMGNRPANETNSVKAKGYFITDASINYNRKNWEAGLAIQNIFNTRWKETQFDTESRLQQEPSPVSEIHFTPGTPFFARLSFSFYF